EDTMKRRLTALAVAALAMLASAMPISAFTPQSSAASHALAWLHTLQSADEEKTAGNIGGLIMAVTAAGLSPTNFAARNLLQDLACTYDASTGAYNSQLFNDALAVLALPVGSAPAKAVAFL